MKVTPSGSGTISVGVGGGVAGKPRLSTQHTCVGPLLILAEFVTPVSSLNSYRYREEYARRYSQEKTDYIAAVIKPLLVSKLMTETPYQHGKQDR